MARLLACLLVLGALAYPFCSEWRLFGIYALYGFFPAPASMADPSREDIDLGERYSKECGRNSLYMLLRMHGCPVGLDQLKQNVDIAAAGSSMLHLRDAARQLRVPTKICKLTLDELVECPKPVIAHLNEHPTYPSGTGHYVVVLAADKKRIDLIDGSFGARGKYLTDSFQKYWSGHILIVVAPFPWSTWAAFASATLWVAVGLWWLGRPRAKRKGSAIIQAPAVSTKGEEGVGKGADCCSPEIGK